MGASKLTEVDRTVGKMLELLTKTKKGDWDAASEERNCDFKK